ncbi:MAG: Fur family transcriptional regulator [Acidimicrobiia bacterium]
MSGVDLGEINREIRRFLKERDIRFTRGRQAVVRALQRAKGPQSAADLHRRLRASVPLSSLYRSLAVLDEAGVLERHHDANGLARFELAEWLAGHHHHLVCTECGEVADVALDVGSEETLSELARVIGSRSDYQVRGHGLEIEGVCAGCSS